MRVHVLLLQTLLLIPAGALTGLRPDAPGPPDTAPSTLPASLPASLPENRPGQYVDVLRGFALIPPADTERVRQSTGRRLVAWVKRDSKTGAVFWTLEVFHTTHEPTSMPADEYAKALAEELSRSGGFQVESRRVTQVAGRPALVFQGLWDSGATFWRQQTWVQVAPTANLVLSISGPVTEKKQLEDTLNAVVGSLRLFDPVEVRKARLESLKRGEQVLAGLSPDKLRALLAPEPTYFLVRLSGTPAGFLKVTEGLTVRNNQPGVLVLRLGALNAPNEPRRLTREEMFVSLDRAIEQWKRTFVEGRDGARLVQEASKNGPLLVVRTVEGQERPRTDQRDFPEGIRDSYLPAAFDVLVPRLISREPGAQYGFAVYNPGVNDFEMRYIRVVGQEKVEVGDRALPAVRLTDQMAIDAPVVDVWVDEKGLVLRMDSTGGVVLERSDHKTVLGKYSSELLELEKMGS